MVHIIYVWIVFVEVVLALIEPFFLVVLSTHVSANVLIVALLRFQTSQLLFFNDLVITRSRIFDFIFKHLQFFSQTIPIILEGTGHRLIRKRRGRVG